MTKCIYCGRELNKDNVYMFEKRKYLVDKCERCMNKLERGEDMCMIEFVKCRDCSLMTPYGPYDMIGYSYWCDKDDIELKEVDNERECEYFEQKFKFVSD